MAVKVVSKIGVPELVARRHRQIVEAAIETFGKRGYHVTTIREVAERAKVSVGLIYQYVEDKEDVLFLALVEVLDSYQRDIPRALEGRAGAMERFCASVRAYGHVIDQRIDATLLVYREIKWLRRERRDLIKAKERETNKLISERIEECIAAGLFRQVDVALLTYQVVMFCHAWALKSWQFQGRMTIDEYVDGGLQLMLLPVVTGPGEQGLVRASTAEQGRARPTDA